MFYDIHLMNRDFRVYYSYPGTTLRYGEHDTIPKGNLIYWLDERD